MKIATARSSHSKSWVTSEISWDGLLARLRTPKRTPENLAAYQQMTPEQRSNVKNVGGFVGGALSAPQRRRDTVAERWLITLDADSVTGTVEDLWLDFTTVYDLTCCVYSTHSHTPERPKLRWVFPLRAPIDPDMYVCVARTVADLIGIDAFDPTTYEPSRLMYWPSCPCDGEYIFLSQDGDRLDAAALLRKRYGDGDAWKAAEWPKGSTEAETERRAYRKAGVPADKPGIIGRFCRAYTVDDAIAEFLSDLYEPCAGWDGGGTGGACEARRYTYIPGTVGGGAVVYDDGAFLYNHNATNPAYGNQNAFDLVRIHLFGERDDETKPDTPVNKRPSYEAMCRFAAALDRVKELAAEEDFSDLDGEDVGEETTETRAEEPENARAWMRELTINKKTGHVEPTCENIQRIMANDPRLKGRFGWNDFRSAFVIRAPLPWKPGVKDRLNGDLWLDRDDAGLRSYFESVYKIESRNKIMDAFRLVGGDNAFHPIREYLNSLTWDGTERLDTMLIRYLAAEDTPYVRAVTRKWMCGAVARVMQPGRKFDNMLVIVGPQGKGKSTFAAKLAKGWFMDSLDDMGSKESVVQIQGRWIIEIAELSAMSKRSVEEVKAFISAPCDNVRLPYDKATQELPRQCVFYGTTNTFEFLKDETGNRRFWPVGVEGVGCGELTGLDEEIDQLWAEAVVRWNAGEVLWLSDKALQEVAAVQQQFFSQQDDLPSLLSDFLDTPIPEDWYKMSVSDRQYYFQSDLPRADGKTKPRDTITVAEIKVELFGRPLTDLGRDDRASSERIIRSLAKMKNWRPLMRKKRLSPGYPQAKTYVRVGSEAELFHTDAWETDRPENS